MRRTTCLLVALPVTLVVAFVALAFFRAQRTLTQSSEAVRTAHQIPFTQTSLDLTHSRALAFEPIAAAASFTSGAVFAGGFALAGPAGLSLFTPDGTPRRALRTGLELPVAPITQLATATLRGGSDPQLLAATAGAGLLLLSLDPSGTPTLQQLLPASPELRDLTRILPLPTGDLLLGTRRHGVLLFNGTHLTPLAFTLSGVDSAALEVTALAAPDPASVLIGTRNQGLFFLHAGTVQHSDPASGLPDPQVDALAVSQGKAYAGTPQGIAEFDLALLLPGQVTLRPTRILAASLFSNALAASASQLTVGTLDQGIVPVSLDARPHLRQASISVPFDPGALSTERVDAFFSAPGPAGPLFALADGRLLVRSSSHWTPALPPAPTPTLTDRNISALAFDSQGRLFVGFFDRGLDILEPGAGQPIRHLEDDHLFCINRLALDPSRHTMAAATANGLVFFDSQARPRQTLTRRDGLISEHVNDLAFTPSGTTLATPAGLTFLKPTGPESLYAFQGLVNNHVYALAPQADPNRLLAGTLGGISILDSSVVTRNLTVTNSALRHNWITAAALLPDGATLLGTYGAGLERLSLARDGTPIFTAIDLPAGAPKDLVINPNALLVTGTHIYAGTLGHGMLAYTNATGRWALITEGLPSRNVTAFASRDGKLYLGTDNGLIRIAEASL